MSCVREASAESDMTRQLEGIQVDLWDPLGNIGLGPRLQGSQPPYQVSEESPFLVGMRTSGYFGNLTQRGIAPKLRDFASKI